MKPTAIREIATEIRLSDGRKEKLTYIGSGTTCLVYRTDSDDIIKEFSPLIGGQPTMSRKKGSCEPFTPIESLTPFDLGILRERRTAFDSEITIVDELNRRYKGEQDNMFLIPKDMPETSLGRCQFCDYVGGKTLRTFFEESRKSNGFLTHFLNVLPLAVSLYDEIALYHRDSEGKGGSYGILNLDVKPDNLFAVKSQGSYIGIRNLDFGSARRIGDKPIGEAGVEPGLLSSVRAYAAEHAECNQELLTERIASKFFATTPAFYDSERVNHAIKSCLDPTKSEDAVISELKLLDIAAAFKTFLWAFSDSDDPFQPSYRGEIELYVMKRLFADIFKNNPLTVHNSLFESYNIYRELYDIMLRIFIASGKRHSCPTASEIADRLRNILCILGGVTENKKTDAQRNFEAMNLALRRKDDLLAAHGLRSIQDILDFCKANGLKPAEKPGNLHWFLVFGEKHE